jgi:CubicO group peptidase (beta-lactamase class C family)
MNDKITTKGNLEDIIINEMETYHIPGLSGAILKKGKVIWEGAFGYADLEASPPKQVEMDTLFYQASVSKAVAAVALMQLWEQGLFNLHDPINDYLLDFSVIHPDYPNKDITFFMLMTHTAAINDNPNMMPTYPGDSPIPLGDYLEGYLTPGGPYYDPFLNFVHEEPGRMHVYSNIGFALAGYLVEVISGMHLDDYCQKNLFGPLGMDESSYLLANLNEDHIAIPYKWVYTQYVPYGHLGSSYYPSGQLRTSTPQLMKFLSAFVKDIQPTNPPFQGGNPNSSPNGGSGLKISNDGSLLSMPTNNKPNMIPRLLDSETAQLMITPQIPHLDPTQGLVWYYYESVSGRKFWGHSGGSKGASTSMYYCFEEEIGFIIMFNAKSPTALLSIGTAMFYYALDHE